MNKLATAVPCASLLSSRALTASVVSNLAAQTGEPACNIWQRIYTRLDAFFGIDINTYILNEGECLLTVAERYDLLDKVYALAYTELLYAQSCED